MASGFGLRTMSARAARLRGHGGLRRPATDRHARRGRRHGFSGTAPRHGAGWLAFRAMGGFRVDLEALGLLGSELDSVREQLDATLRAVGDPPPGGLGGAELDRACGEFRDSWSHGLERLGACAAAVRDGVDRTRAAYAAVDHAVQEAVQR